MNKHQKQIVLTVIFGNILEWYDIYSYAYFAPILAKVFFNFDSSINNLVGAFIIFATGFLTRPLGGVIFGRVGDLIGRKTAFIWSIILITVPTFIMGCLPTYAESGILAPILLGLLRILQSIPSSGEVPGTICFLYENADATNTKYLPSWAGVGNQIGAIVGLATTFLIDKLMPEQYLTSWGWRASFWIGGIIGLFGFYLRQKLDETPVYKKLKAHCRLDTETTYQAINNHKKPILLGVAFCAVNASTFYIIATYVPTYLNKALGLTHIWNAAISLSLLTLTTILLPFFGKLGEVFNAKNILVISALATIALLFPLYTSIYSQNMLWIAVIGALYVIPIAAVTALLPYVLAHIFPSQVRFTGIGLSYNIADGIIGGFTPAVALLMLQYTHNQGAFCWFILVCTIISLFSYLVIKGHSQAGINR